MTSGSCSSSWVSSDRARVIDTQQFVELGMRRQGVAPGSTLSRVNLPCLLWCKVAKLVRVACRT